MMAVSTSETLILTASTAQARQQAQIIRQAGRKSGQAVWRAQTVLPLNTWIVESWLGLWPETQLLGPVHELVLYRDAIERSGINEHLLDVMQIARAARQASSLAAEYGLEPIQWRPVSEEEAAFQSWHADVQKRMQHHQWVTRREVVDELIQALSRAEWSPPAVIKLVGLEPTPLQQKLLHALQEKGTQIERYSANYQSELKALAFTDPQSQYRYLAQAIGDRLNDLDTETVIVAVPRADAQTIAVLDRILTDVCLPKAKSVGESGGRVPWRYDQAPPLDQHPWVALALTVLALRTHGNELAAVSRLLLSADFWPVTERGQRANVDWQLRKDGRLTISLKYLLRLLEKCGAEQTHQWVADCLEYITSLPYQALPSAWADIFANCLATTGLDIPDAELDDDGAQAAEAWLQTLNLLASLDSLLGEINQSAALQWLRELCAQRHHQANTGYSQPVRFVEYAELSGLEADRIWILDAIDSVLPFGMINNAFLPHGLMQEAGAVVTPEQASAQTQTWLHRVRQQCKELIVLAPERDWDGNECLPSRLFDWQGEPSQALNPSEAAVCTPAEDRAPAVEDQQAEGIGGGSALLKDYAHAPFIALAKRRLGCDAFPEKYGELDALVQGNLVHRCLELSWLELKDSDQLQGKSELQLTKLAELSAVQACEEGLYAVGPILQRMEQARLTDVVTQWLLHEQKREHAFEVVKHEQGGSVVINGLDLGYRIDRIDKVQTEQGDRILLIDYKTGSQAYRMDDWYPESLSEPQLPFYACHADLTQFGITQVDGIAFARVREAANQFHSMTNFCGPLIPNRRSKNKAVEDWNARIEAWRTAIDDMVEGFLVGRHEFDIRGDYLAANSRSFDAFLAALMRAEGEPS